MKNSTKTLSGIFCLLVILFLFCGTWGLQPYYKMGTYTGTIVQVAHGGIFNDSYEVVMVENPSRGTASCLDPILGEKLKALTGQRVMVVYSKWLIPPFFKQSDDCNIVRVDTSHVLEGGPRD